MLPCIALSWLGREQHGLPGSRADEQGWGTQLCKVSFRVQLITKKSFSAFYFILLMKICFSEVVAKRMPVPSI